MNIEELPPNKPNFALIVGIFAVAIVLIVAGALLFVRHVAKKEPAGKHAGDPLSMLRHDKPGARSAIAA